MSKRYKQLIEKIDSTKAYSAAEAAQAVKELKS
jgi:large subunit ribosomal protein L1